jgi:glycosyltransferase involved in cell wall biosynthesis
MRLEDLLAAVAERKLAPFAPRPASCGTTLPSRCLPAPGRVLHVVTEAHSVGGHTRLVWRWIQRDAARVHSVVVTGGRSAVPAPLAEAAARSGGTVWQLANEVRGRALARAGHLRRLAARFDAVVLHVHPSDAVAMLAFAPGSERPPVVFVNHADHVFWLGAAVADLYAHIRPSGLRLAVGRRGVAEGRSAVVPVPVDTASRTLSRAGAKRALGLEERDTVLLTVANAFKFDPVGGVGFLDLVAPVVASRRRVVLLAVGPSDAGAWREAGDRSGGRIRALGVRSDLSVLHQAADVYIDSYPIGSLTSFLEAGTFGTPLVRLCPEPGWEVLCSDDPGRDTPVAVSPASAAQFGDELSRLLDDAQRREALGAAARDAIEAAHGPGPWQEALEAVYQRAGELRSGSSGGPRRVAEPGDGSSPGLDARPGTLDEQLCRLNWRPLGLQPALRGTLGLLAPRERGLAMAALAGERALRPLARTDELRHRLEHRLLGRARAGGRGMPGSA